MTASWTTSSSSRDEEPDGEPGDLIRKEAGRLAHHPREEVARLRSEREGESGATPFMAIAALGPPLIVLVIAVAVAVYYLAR
jgi:hypothetical protein